MWSFLCIIVTAYAISPTLVHEVSQPLSVDICHNEEPESSSSFPHGICAQAGSTTSASAMCDFNIASAGWQAGSCSDAGDYKVGCAGAYDIVIWIKVADCDKCTGGTFQLVEDTAHLCPAPENDGVCYHETGATDAFPDGTCTTAGSVDSPSTMCDYNIQHAGYAVGTCSDNTDFKVGCVGKYDIVFWIKQSDCANCVGNKYHLLSDTADLCPTEDVGVCFKESSPSANWPHGTCSTAGSEDVPSDMCSYNIKEAGYKEGTCADNTEYKVGCIGMYDIVFWIKTVDCSLCSGGNFSLLPSTSGLCPHDDDVTVCYGISESTGSDWTNGKTCAQAGSAASPSMMCEYNIEYAGYHEGTCASTNIYTVGCMGMYYIVFWIQPADCLTCLNKHFKLVEDTEYQCHAYLQQPQIKTIKTDEKVFD